MRKGSDILLDFYENFQKLEGALSLFGQDIVEDPAFADLTTNLVVEQHRRGERSDGTPIEPPYTEYTVKIKKEKGQESRFVTLEDTEDYHNSLRVKVYPDKFEVYGTDFKKDVYGNTFNTGEHLAAKYNEGNGDIHGLQEESLEQTRTFMKPEFISFIRHFFNLN